MSAKRNQSLGAHAFWCDRFFCSNCKKTENKICCQCFVPDSWSCLCSLFILIPIQTVQNVAHKFWCSEQHTTQIQLIEFSSIRNRSLYSFYLNGTSEKEFLFKSTCIHVFFKKFHRRKNNEISFSAFFFIFFWSFRFRAKKTEYAEL